MNGKTRTDRIVYACMSTYIVLNAMCRLAVVDSDRDLKCKIYFSQQNIKKLRFPPCFVLRLFQVLRLFLLI